MLLANGRIPAIIDKTNGASKRVFEGAAIQLYLCAKYDKDLKISFEYDSAEYWEMVEWLVWMQSGIGPMQGEFDHPAPLFFLLAVLRRLVVEREAGNAEQARMDGNGIMRIQGMRC